MSPAPNSPFLEKFEEARLLVILRTTTSDTLVDLVGLLWESGARFVEITRNTPGCLEALATLSPRVPAGCFLGMGTALCSQHVKEARDSGASFVVSPIVSKEVQESARQMRLATVPGAWSPTEVFTAWTAGSDIVKVFPAQTPSYIEYLRGPFSEIPLMAVGGVTLENAREYLLAGARGVAIGRGVLGIDENGGFDPKRLTTTIWQFRQALGK